MVSRVARPTSCTSCQRARFVDIGAAAAPRAVHAAIKRGDLLPASAHECADCGLPARDYDHRDYNQPLAVEPVCRRCNKARGPAIPVRS